MKKELKKIIPLTSLIIILASTLLFNAGKSGAPVSQINQAGDIRVADIDKIENIIRNILSLNLTTAKTPAPDKNDPPQYPRPSIRDPFRFGATLSVRPDNQRPVKVRSEKTGTSIKKPPVINPQSIIISGIIFDRQNPAAIIGGEVYHVGDSLNTFKIEKIYQNALILSGYGKRYNLKVPEDE